MLTIIVVLALLLVAGFVAYNAKTPTGWDVKKGLAALAAAIAAAALWFSGLLGGTPQ